VISDWLKVRIGGLHQRERRLTSTVSAVLTSCGRADLLVRTLDSFFRFNTCPIAQLLVVEDGYSVPEQLSAYSFPCAYKIICTGERVGQIAAIDYAYSRLESEYIFHLEDDWEFYASGFIERSLSVLERHPNCLQVHLRALDDINGHPIGDKVHDCEGVTWRRLVYGYLAGGFEWNGFSFNPGLRRLADYIAVGGYGVHNLAAGSDTRADAAEAALSRLYRQRKMFAAVLSDRGGAGYVKHTGWGRSVE
jgi:hypothetical protein